MPAPSYVSNSTYSGGQTSVSITLPATYTTDDILVLVIESANQYLAQAATNLTNNGWSRVANSNTMLGVAAAANATYMDIWWSRPSTTAQTAVTLGDYGDHTLAVVGRFANCVTTGSPWDTGTAAGINVTVGTATAQVNSYGVTTSTANTLVLTVINSPQDIAAGRINASPLLLIGGSAGDTELTERFDYGDTAGGGGTIAVLTHRAATTGTTANVRANTTVANTAILWTGALKGIPNAFPFSFACFT
jgi:hypothetical protein